MQYVSSDFDVDSSSLFSLLEYGHTDIRIDRQTHIKSQTHTTHILALHQLLPAQVMIIHRIITAVATYGDRAFAVIGPSTFT